MSTAKQKWEKAGRPAIVTEAECRLFAEFSEHIRDDAYTFPGFQKFLRDSIMEEADEGYEAATMRSKGVVTAGTLMRSLARTLDGVGAWVAMIPDAYRESEDEDDWEELGVSAA